VLANNSKLGLRTKDDKPEVAASADPVFEI
jgi:hypothetical protein